MAQGKSEQTNYSLENILSPSSWGRNGLFTPASLKAEFENGGLGAFYHEYRDLFVGGGAMVGAIVGAMTGGFAGSACGALLGAMLGFAILACISMIQSIQSEIGRNPTTEPDADQYAPHNGL